MSLLRYLGESILLHLNIFLFVIQLLKFLDFRYRTPLISSSDFTYFSNIGGFTAKYCR